MNLSQALQSASLTDPGRVRDHNEDCVEARPEIGLYVLADGMGGYNAGEVASGMATSLIADGLAEVVGPEGRGPALPRGGDGAGRAPHPRADREGQHGHLHHLAEQPRMRGDGHHPGGVPVLRQLRLRGPHRRLAALPAAGRGDGAGHPRPFAAAGAARLRAHHARRRRSSPRTRTSSPRRSASTPRSSRNCTSTRPSPTTSTCCARTD